MPDTVLVTVRSNRVTVVKTHKSKVGKYEGENFGNRSRQGKKVDFIQ